MADYLYYRFVADSDGTTIKSFLSIIPLDSTSVEICAYTDIPYRNQGLFTALLTDAISDLKSCGITNIYSDCPLELDQIQCFPSHRECLMELDCATSFVLDDDYDIIEYDCLDNEYPYVLTYKETPIGLFFINVNGTSATINRVKIRKPFRGMGHAKSLLLGGLSCFINSYNQDIKFNLHVSDNNLAAFNLYNKLGFKVTDSIQYYLLDLQ